MAFPVLVRPYCRVTWKQFDIFIVGALIQLYWQKIILVRSYVVGPGYRSGTAI